MREPKNFGKDMEAARQYLEAGRSQGYGFISGVLNWISDNAFGADKVWLKHMGQHRWFSCVVAQLVGGVASADASWAGVGAAAVM